MHTYVHTYIHTYVHMYTYANAYIHIYIYTHCRFTDLFSFMYVVVFDRHRQINLRLSIDLRAWLYTCLP